MNIKDELKNFLSERVKENTLLSQFTSFKTGGIAKIIVFPENKEEVKEIFYLSEKYQKDILILGKGTNILISDYGFDGIVLSTLLLNKIKKEENFIISESGVLISSLLNFCLKNNSGGIEFLSGIPGTIGGALITNAGLKKEWIGEKVEWVEIYDKKKKDFEILKREEIKFSYRDSNLKNMFIINACLRTEKKRKEEIKNKIQNYMKERREKQPLRENSAGSVFKNPENFYAGELIEKCGLKGYCIGDACISERHANFIINKGKAKSSDIYNLIKIIQNKVKEKFGIELELEI
ncbi:MAG TPA: UDP-N-acetylmuramate dehydrogenase, partial [Candidatus Ratteibacteria bacterium]|nr:UDP-N-acetylmuramate dehydrogenase [Candidatus Ratteibacteria bacterium]